MTAVYTILDLHINCRREVANVSRNGGIPGEQLFKVRDGGDLKIQIYKEASLKIQLEKAGFHGLLDKGGQLLGTEKHELDEETERRIEEKEEELVAKKL